MNVLKMTANEARDRAIVYRQRIENNDRAIATWKRRKDPTYVDEQLGKLQNQIDELEAKKQEVLDKAKEAESEIKRLERLNRHNQKELAKLEHKREIDKLLKAVASLKETKNAKDS